jgi:pre-mRNA-processing factor 40
MNGYPPPMGAPATPWKAVQDGEGKTYYYNQATQQTTWEKPEDLYDDYEVID